MLHPQYRFQKTCNIKSIPLVLSSIVEFQNVDQNYLNTGVDLGKFDGDILSPSAYNQRKSPYGRLSPL